MGAPRSPQSMGCADVDPSPFSGALAPFSLSPALKAEDRAWGPGIYQEANFPRGRRAWGSQVCRWRGLPWESGQQGVDLPPLRPPVGSEGWLEVVEATESSEGVRGLPLSGRIGMILVGSGW